MFTNVTAHFYNTYVYFNFFGINFDIFFKFYFIFKLYNIVLVLPNIEMNQMEVFLVLSISFFPLRSLPRISVGFLFLGALRRCRSCFLSDEAVNSRTS